MKIFKSLLRGVLVVAVLGGVLLCGRREAKADEQYNITYKADNKVTIIGVDGFSLRNSASAGDIIKIKVTHNEGYKIEVMVPGVDLRRERDNVYSFVMPAHDVTISAQTKAIDPDPEPEVDHEVDHDTFKSEEPSGTILASSVMGANQLFDFKVHATDARSTANQEFLAQALIRPGVETIVTKNVYPRRDLSITEEGSEQVLAWGNLPKNEAGPAYAVVYNQKDGAYVLDGALDRNGVATFSGFKLRPASTITICK